MTAVFFDLDNTLVDHSGAGRAASTLFYEAIADRTAASSPEEFAQLWNRVQDRHMARYVAVITNGDGAQQRNKLHHNNFCVRLRESDD